MKITKKLLTVIIALSLILSQSIAAFAIEFTDVENSSSYKDAIYTLADFKIILGDAGSNTFRPNDNISREEFSVIMTRVLGLGALNINVTEYPFTDVTPATSADWSIKATKIAYDLGIIKGMGDGTFEPKSNVTYEQAVKMIVCALGYEAPSLEQGGWPNGYLSVARSKGITKKAEMAQDKPASRGIIAQLIYNALEVDLMVPVTSAGNEAKYKIMTGENLLTNKLKYVKGKGAVTGVQNSAFTHAGTSIKANEVEIDYNTKFLIGETEANKYLGKLVNYYYIDSDDDEKTLVTARLADTNKEIEVQAENIKQITSSSISYWLDKNDLSDVETYNFASGAKCIYNGKYVSDINASITPYNGKVVLIDNNNDDAIDYLIVTASNVIFVDAVDATNYQIFDKYNQSNILTLDPTSKDTITYKENGSTASFGSISKGDVLIVTQSLNPTGSKMISIDIISKKVTGTVTEMNTDASAFSINGTLYDCSRAYLNYVDNNPSEQVQLDDKITAYLDNESKIVAVTVSEAASMKYGYLITGDAKESNEYARLRIYTQDNQLVTLKGATKIKINGSSKPYAEVLPALDATNAQTNQDEYASNYDIAQLIKYTTNTKGEIDTIVTLKTSGDTTKDLVLSSPYNETAVPYKSSSKTLDTLTSLDTSTKVFYVPTDRSETSDYSVKTYSFLVNDRKYNFEAYDESETNVAKVIVLYGESGTISTSDPSAPVAIVDTKTTVTDDGVSVTRLGCYVNNVLVYYNAINTDILSDFSKGDVIKLGINAQGKISSAALVYSIYSQPPQTTKDRYITAGANASSSEAEYRTVFGTVYGRDDERMTVSLSDIDSSGNLDSSELYTIPFSSGIKYYVLDISGSSPSLTEGTLNNIAGFTSAKTGASKVFVYTKSGVTKFIMIMKETR